MTWRRPDQIARPLAPPHLTRYPWYRTYNDFTRHPKWRVIAKALRLPLTEVLGVAQEILRAANICRPRGSLAEFSIVESAAALDLPGDHVARVYAAMIEQGWIDGDYLVTWDERQPDREDPTNKARQQRFRHKRKEERDAARNAVTRNSVTPQRNSVTPQRNGGTKMAESVTQERNSDENQRNSVTQNVTRNSVTASRKAEQAKLRMRKMRALRKGNVDAMTRNAVTCVTSRPDETRSIHPGDNISAVEWEESAVEWLMVKGLETVMRVGRLRELSARIKLQRWREALNDDDALRDLIYQAAAVATDARFLSLIGQGVAHIVSRPLPLPPVRIAR